MNVLDFIKKKGVGFIINAVVVMIAIVGFILYLVSADDKSGMTETAISPIVIILYIVGIGMSIATLFINSDLTKILTAVVYIATLVFWISSQAGFIVNVMMGTDGNSFSVAYILCVVFTILAIVLSFLTIIKPKKKDFSD